MQRVANRRGTEWIFDAFEVHFFFFFFFDQSWGNDLLENDEFERNNNQQAVNIRGNLCFYGFDDS